MRAHPEDNLQRAVAQYLDLRGWLWVHVANERKTSPRRGYRLKQMGVKPGVPDVLIFEKWETVTVDEWTGDGGFGIAIELKSPKGRTTKSQDHWLAELQRRGWKVAVCRTLVEVVEICELIR